MKKFTLLLTAALLTSSMVACSGKSTDTKNTTETIELPTIDMVATHAIDLDIAVSQLTFVPNSAAPWLGRIILLDDAGQLYSTDIEGRDPKLVGSGKYIDILGLAREAAPGVFLAITGNNKIEAFIESDDVGNFSPMIYSGESIVAQALCFRQKSSPNYTIILSTDGNLNTLDLNIQDTHLEQTIVDTAKAPKKAKTCAAEHQPVEVNEYTWVKKNLNLIARPLDEDLPSNKIKITNGLSVLGLQNVKHVASTTSNYGGGAYARGVLALVDADENRIVFISLSYAERQLRKAVNPAEETSQ